MLIPANVIEKYKRAVANSKNDWQLKEAEDAAFDKLYLANGHEWVGQNVGLIMCDLKQAAMEVKGELKV